MAKNNIQLNGSACFDAEKVIYFWFESLKINMFFSDGTDVPIMYSNQQDYDEDKDTIINYITGETGDFRVLTDLYVRYFNINAVTMNGMNNNDVYLNNRKLSYNSSTNILTVL